MAVLKDVERILSSADLQGCSLVPRALADMHKLFGLARSSARAEKDCEFSDRITVVSFAWNTDDYYSNLLDRLGNQSAYI